MGRGPNPRLISVGSVVADIRLELPCLPARGGDVIGSAATVSAGGGFNILCAAARQGLPTLFAGRHGTGPYGDRIRADFSREGIATFHRPTADGDSGFCLVMVEPDGERTFVSSPGVEAALGPRRLGDVPVGSGDWVFVSGYDLAYPALGLAIAVWAAELPKDVRLVVDPGPLAGAIPEPVLRAVMPRAAIWTMNAREAGLLTETQEPAEVRRRLRPGLSGSAMLILRDGAAGAYLSEAEGAVPMRIPSLAVAMIDSTGAGDTHTGVLIAALAEGETPSAAVRRANVAAALSVTRAGPATAPDRAALDACLTHVIPKQTHHRRSE
jgi:sugar/nucleoside kinase (ribokinase family)